MKYYCAVCKQELFMKGHTDNKIWFEPCSSCYHKIERLKKACAPKPSRYKKRKNKHIAKAHNNDMVTAYLMYEDGY
jgi:hypothetical protein